MDPAFFQSSSKTLTRKGMACEQKNNSLSTDSKNILTCALSQGTLSPYVASNCSDKENTNTEQMNLSAGESTGVLLTKALNTLSGDFDVVTPPRNEKAQTNSTQKDKKVSLFRPYDLDNGKSSEKKSVPSQSPMLLRSNYSSSGQQWLIEKRSKSETVVNCLGIQLTANVVELNQKCDNGVSIQHSAETTSQESKTVNVQTLSIPVSRPLRSSTPKNSPCPSPNLPQLTPIPTVDAQSREVDKTVGRTKFLLQHSSNNSLTPITAPELPAFVRYHTSAGHRLPLKHSYKHQSVVCEQPRERSQSPDGPTESKDIRVKDRYRSNSCPPITKHPDSTTINTKSLTTHQALALQQKGILSNATKSYIDAVKETWAMHHAVMSSKVPLSSCGKHVLPSFSTFTNKLSNNLEKTSTFQAVNKYEPSGAICTKEAGVHQKHARSKSEEMPDSGSIPPVRPPATGVVKALEKSQFDHAVPVSCFSNFNLNQNTNLHDRAGTQHATKTRTWHVPSDIRANTPDLENEISEKQCTSQRQRKNERNIQDGGQTVSSSHKISVPNMLKNIQRQWVHDSSQYLKPYGNISGQYTSEETREVLSNIPKPVPSLTRHFNPPTDIYRDPTPFAMAGLDPKLQMFIPPQVLSPNMLVPPGLVPGRVHPMQMHSFSVHDQEKHAEALKRDLPAMRPSPKQNVHTLPSVGNIPDEKVFLERKPTEGPRPSSRDSRRPLSTSALQNQPLLPSMTPEPKVPIAPLMMMVKFFKCAINNNNNNQ